MGRTLANKTIFLPKPKIRLHEHFAEHFFMNSLTCQKLNYLYWLKDRGLSAPPHPCQQKHESRYLIGQKCMVTGNSTELHMGLGPVPAKLVFLGHHPPPNSLSSTALFAPKETILFEKMIQAMGLDMKNIFQSNLLVCSEKPTAVNFLHHAQACLPSLQKQLALVKPEIVVIMGKLATTALFPNTKTHSFAQMVGSWQNCEFFPNSKVFIIHHPHEMLLEPALKRPTWEGLKRLMKALNC